MKASSVRDFQSLVERYEVLKGADACPERRPRPEIPVSQVARALVLGPAFGAPSLIRIDEFTRASEARHLGLVPLSDALIEKVLPAIPLSIPHRELDDLYERAVAKGLCTLKLADSPRLWLRVGHVDGTYGLTHHFTFLTVSGSLELILRLREMANAGEELPSAKAMVREALRAHPFTFPDLVSFDGKYVDFAFLREMKGYHRDWLVRIRGDDGRNLDVVKQIRQKIAEGAAGITSVSGIDLGSQRAYTLWRVEGIHQDRYGHPLVGFQVQVRYLKGKRAGSEETHYGITSAEDLSARDLWAIRKSHWHIETLFRTLKREFWSRHSYLAGAHEAQGVGALVCLSLNLLALYRWECGQEKASRGRRALPRTLRQWIRKLLESLIRWAMATALIMNSSRGSQAELGRTQDRSEAPRDTLAPSRRLRASAVFLSSLLIHGTYCYFFPLNTSVVL